MNLKKVVASSRRMAKTRAHKPTILDLSKVAVLAISRCASVVRYRDQTIMPATKSRSR